MLFANLHFEARSAQSTAGAIAWASPGDGAVASAAPVKTLLVSTLTGQSLDLAQQPGWCVIYFWSAECPCVADCENFTFRPLAKQYAGMVSFYAVVSGGYDLSQPVGSAAQDVAKHHLPYPVVIDTHHKAALALGAQVTPETFVIDPQNHVVFAGMPDDYSRFLESQGGRRWRARILPRRSSRRSLA